LGISFAMIRTGDPMANTFQLGSHASVVPFVIRGAAAPAAAAVRASRPHAEVLDIASDDSLVARVAGGDRKAMRSVVLRHQQKVYIFVLRQVADCATAEDIVSEVFIELWRQAPRFEGRAQLSTWLLAIARNKSRSAMRRRRIDVPLDADVAAAIPDSAPTPEDALDTEKRGALLRTCLERLSSVHREIIDLVYFHENSVEEASAITGIPVATVKTRMFYARQQLGALLRAAGIHTTQS
jgi:RNA polymerase sigma-70 factor, ECF subfamily